LTESLEDLGNKQQMTPEGDDETMNSGPFFTHASMTMMLL